MLRRTRGFVEHAEARARAGDLDGMYAAIRNLSIDEVGRLLLDVPAEYPALQRALPRMASARIQRDWTGSEGDALLQQSVAFTRALLAGFRRHSAIDVSAARILDFGCGWGRLLRLLLAEASPGQLFAADPWQVSLDICRQDGVPGRFALSDYLPTSLPFGDTRFDLVYAFSVFTHTSERATRLALEAIRRRISGDGVLVITVRPREYWEHHAFDQASPGKAELLAAHDARGFAFKPHQIAAIDGDVTYGDTSITPEYLAGHIEGWRIVGTDWNAVDPWQYIVFLKPA